MEPVARTAFYCCAIRADDAATAVPVCGDTLAARFLDDDIRRDIAPALGIKAPAASNVARHRIIDDLVREALREDAARRIVLIGAGFDTRAFRLPGGRWWEIDDPVLMAFKEARLPAGTAPNPLVRVSVDLRENRLGEHLAAIAGDDEALVVLEGVSMYMPHAAITRLATEVRTHLPRARLVCDLMSPAFASRFSRPLHRALNRLGASFAPMPGHPRVAVEAAGYRATASHSIVDRAREAGSVRIPGWLMATLLRELRDGYQVWTFTAA